METEQGPFEQLKIAHPLTSVLALQHELHNSAYVNFNLCTLF